MTLRDHLILSLQTFEDFKVRMEERRERTYCGRNRLLAKKHWEGRHEAYILRRSINAIRRIKDALEVEGEQ